jgi:hypothetical protein
VIDHSKSILHCASQSITTVCNGLYMSVVGQNRSLGLFG